MTGTIDTLRRHLRIWWLSITTPDSPITIEVERHPEHDVEFIVYCPDCGKRHTFDRELQDHPTGTQYIWQARGEIKNDSTIVELRCYVCGNSFSRGRTTFLHEKMTGPPYTHRFRITDAHDE